MIYVQVNDYDKEIDSNIVSVDELPKSQNISMIILENSKLFQQK